MNDAVRIAFVTSHPIQYQVPVFRCLTDNNHLDLTVLFATMPDAAAQGAGFGVSFAWDIPLLEGYKYRVLENVSRSPGVTTFSGCDTPGIYSVLRELNIDAVVVNGWVVKTCLQTLRAARKMRIPCIVRGEANNLRHRSWWKRMLQRQLVQRYDAVLPIGKANRAFYRSHGVPELRMFNAPYCIENDRFAKAAVSSEQQRAEVRTRFNVPQNALCFLYCGKFEQKKHPVELVDAFLASDRIEHTMGQSVPRCLLMVGDGELKAECESHVATYQRTNPTSNSSVYFAGFLNQSQIIDAYVAADVLALPSDAGETWGLVVNEAMACGRPAIVSDLVGCAEDLIVPDRTGWVFPFGNWNALRDLFGRVLESRSNLASMQEHCRKRIAEYSPQHAAAGIEAAVRSLITDRRRT